MHKERERREELERLLLHERHHENVLEKTLNEEKEKFTTLERSLLEERNKRMDTERRYVGVCVRETESDIKTFDGRFLQN